MGGARHVGWPAKVTIWRARQRRVSVAGRDKNWNAGRPQCLEDEGCGFARHVVLLEQIAAAGDQLYLFVLGALDDPSERLTQVLSMPLGTHAIEVFAGKRPVEMQVSEMEQAKGHKSPVTTQNQPGASAMPSAKQRPL